MITNSYSIRYFFSFYLTLFLFFFAIEIFPTHNDTLNAGDSFHSIKIAVVNLEVLIKNYKKYTILKHRFKILKSDFFQKKEIKEEEISNLMKNVIKKDDPNFNINILKNQFLEIEEKKSKLAQWIDSENKIIKNLANNLKKELLEEILTVIENFRKKKNITLIFHKTGLIAFEKNLEITSEILEILNQNQ